MLFSEHDSLFPRTAFRRKGKDHLVHHEMKGYLNTSQILAPAAGKKREKYNGLSAVSPFGCITARSCPQT